MKSFFRMVVAVGMLAVALPWNSVSAATPDELQAQAAAIEARIEAADLGMVMETTSAPRDKIEYMRGKVLSLQKTGEREMEGGAIPYKIFRVQLTTGPDRNQTVDVEQNDIYLTSKALNISIGDTIVVAKSTNLSGSISYDLVDKYRINPLIWITLLFLLLAVAFGGLRGLTSVAGLVASALVIVFFVIPQILSGSNPLWICIFAALIIAVISLYLAHGFNARTSIALASTLITLVISAVMAIVVVQWTSIFGTGSEDALYLQGLNAKINLRGLLLGGIMLGLLGVLDDVTTGQSAIVDELKAANPALGFSELYKRALSVGREHITSLINTLFLAYAGVSLPLFLLVWTSREQPLWMIINSELISEEIVRTIVGSACLILAVPITTALAAYFYGVRGIETTSPEHRGHHH